MKVYFRILLLFVFSVCLFGWYPAFYLLRNSVKQDMMQKIKFAETESNCIKMDFTVDEFKSLNWIEENEFRLDEVMYDVISVKQKGRVVTVFCFADNKDSWLFNELSGRTVNGSGRSDKTAGYYNLLELLSFSFIVPSGEFLFPETVVRENNTIIKVEFESVIAEVISPPPQL